MTPSELKRKHQDAVPCSHYFDAETMRHFGDTMANYGVRTSGAYWELYRKKPVKDGLQTSAYFDKTTFQRRLDTRV